MSELLTWWSRYYGNHQAISVTIRSLHLLGLAVGGGSAVAADRRVLRAARRHIPAFEAVSEMHASHRVVISALAVIVATGLLMALSDMETYATSLLFWTKMGLVAGLMVNGAVLALAGKHAMRTGASVPRRLAIGCALSIALWLTIVYASSWLMVAA